MNITKQKIAEDMHQQQLENAKRKEYERLKAKFEAE